MIKATMEKGYEKFESLFLRFLKERNLLVGFDNSFKSHKLTRLIGRKYPNLTAYIKMLVASIEASVIRYEKNKQSAIGPFVTITEICPHFWNCINFILHSYLIANRDDYGGLCTFLHLSTENGNQLEKLTLNNISCLLVADFIIECLHPLIPDEMTLELMKRESRYCFMSRPRHFVELEGDVKNKWDWLMSFD